MEIRSPSGITYNVGILSGYSFKENGKPECKFYCCTTNKGGYILKITEDAADNWVLDREMLTLRTLLVSAENVDSWSLSMGQDGRSAGYRLVFPHAIETWVEESQGGRRIAILDVEAVNGDLSQLIPVSYVTRTNNLRVDPKTAAWIMGRLLKLLVFTHGEGVKGLDLSDGNIMLATNQHIVIPLDWSKAHITGEPIENREASREIVSVALLVAELLGWDPSMGSIPESDQLTNKRFEDYLRHLIAGHESDAGKAHGMFYRIVDSIWQKSFHPYTTITK